jgi:hypothetical protein
MTFKSWFLGLSDNEKVAFFGVIGCGIGGLLLWAGQQGGVLAFCLVVLSVSFF